MSLELSYSSISCGLIKMLSLAVFILVLSILVIVHEFGHFIAAKKAGVKVERFSLGFGQKIFSIRKKETEYTICAIPLGGYVKLSGDNLEEHKGKPDEYLTQPVSRRFGIIFCGPLLNYVLGFLFFWMIFFAGYPTLTTKVGALLDGMGAKEAGIEVGDKIIAVEGKKVALWEALQESIQSNKSKEKVLVTVLRNAKEYKFEVRIKQTSLEDILGQKRNVGLIGIKPDLNETIKIRHGFLESFLRGMKKTFELTGLTYKALWLMIIRKMSIKESVSGPLGIFFVTSQATKMGIIALMHLMAVLSISLAIFNLLPLPALDGGHILLLAIEKVRGKYLSQKAEEIFSRIGLSFIIFVAILVFYNDLSRFGFIEKITKFFSK
jgi:regulator of sigma E protease